VFNWISMPRTIQFWLAAAALHVLITSCVPLDGGPPELSKQRG
jgi:hypothetical protein